MNLVCKYGKPSLMTVHMKFELLQCGCGYTECVMKIFFRYIRLNSPNYTLFAE